MTAIKEIEALKAKAGAIKKRWPIYIKMVDLLADLIAETIRAESRVCLPGNQDKFALKGRDFARGRSLFEPGAFPVDVDLTMALYPMLAKRAMQFKGQSSAGLDQVLSGEKLDSKALIAVALEPESQVLASLCEKNLVDPEPVRLLVRLALRPSVRRLSREMADLFDFTRWSRGRCPVCGAPPALAELGGEGKSRTLHCALCETSWAYPRLGCPFCENQDQEDLGYSYAEGETELRIDRCRRCGQGLKTIETGPASAPVILLLDDLVFSHLVIATGGIDGQRVYGL